MESKGKKAKKNKFILFIATVFAAVCVFSAVMLIRELKQTKEEADTFKKLAAMRLPQKTSSARPEADIQSTASPGPISTQTQPVVDETEAANRIEKPGKANATSEPEAPSGTEAVGENETVGETGAASETIAEIGGTASPALPSTTTPAETPNDPPEEGQASGSAPTESTEPVPLQQYLPLYELNKDFFGWITIPGTNVDYPVMYSPDRPLQYLGHDFYGKFSYGGVPYLDPDCDPNGSYYLVYGHKMRDGSMFGSLLAYEDESFWETHREFSFDTLYEERTYEVVAAMRTRVLNKDELSGFRYYNYASLDSEEEFEEYMQQVRQLALYDTGIDTAFGDELLVLSTCYHYTKNGRFVIVARRVVD